MSKHREQSLINRFDILKKCYPLLAEGSWDAITIADLEKAISQTRGAIAYYHKNKQTLLNNLMDELFFPVFGISDNLKETLSKCTISDFHKRYKTPFERLRDDLRDNYHVSNPSQAIFNLFIQGAKHYNGFTPKINDLMKMEEEYMCELVGGRVNSLIDLNKVYVQNIGNIFVESLNVDITRHNW
ncbi:MAG: TetR/AcrR family transcriptional regulator [Lachnospiraceae bacterium]|nr:TetR/AcrR family transcriptional regulator [Lachnospiraceae bacterium]